MAIALRQSTASQEIPLGYFVNSTDADTEETGLTIANTDIKIWKNGATSLSSKNSGGATHISNGIYYAVLDATDTNTIGPLVAFCHVSGALTVRVECVVYDEAVYDALFGTDGLATTVSAVGSVTGAVGSVTGAVGSVTGNVGGNVTGNVGGNVTGSVGSLATQAKADVNAEVVDCLNVDTYAEPSSAPASTSTLVAKIKWIFAILRHKRTQTTTTETLLADDETTPIATSAKADSAGTFTRGRWS